MNRRRYVGRHRRGIVATLRLWFADTGDCVTIPPHALESHEPAYQWRHAHEPEGSVLVMSFWTHAQTA